MKKLFTSAVLLITVTMLFAQPEVTKFLGIPVDGTKSEMISKLKAKGYTWNSTLECLEGEFNGRDVMIRVVTNNNKVYRILVRDKYTCNETDIRIRFNTLLSQFIKNDRYFPDFGASNEPIDEDENISFNISVNKKRYQASFIQFDKKILADTILYRNKLEQYLNDRYPEEEIAELRDKLNEDSDFAFQFVSNMYEDWFGNNSVWFMISEEYGKYRILLFYDNNNNAANGEDL